MRHPRITITLTERMVRDLDDARKRLQRRHPGPWPRAAVARWLLSAGRGELLAREDEATGRGGL